MQVNPTISEKLWDFVYQKFLEGMQNKETNMTQTSVISVSAKSEDGRRIFLVDEIQKIQYQQNEDIHIMYDTNR